MKQKPLIETNPYLHDPEKFRKALIKSVASSTAIEAGASAVASICHMLEERHNIKSAASPDSAHIKPQNDEGLRRAPLPQT